MQCLTAACRIAYMLIGLQSGGGNTLMIAELGTNLKKIRFRLIKEDRLYYKMQNQDKQLSADKPAARFS